MRIVWTLACTIGVAWGCAGARMGSLPGGYPDVLEEFLPRDPSALLELHTGLPTGACGVDRFAVEDARLNHWIARFGDEDAPRLYDSYRFEGSPAEGFVIERAGNTPGGMPPRISVAHYDAAGRFRGVERFVDGAWVAHFTCIHGGAPESARICEATHGGPKSVVQLDSEGRIALTALVSMESFSLLRPHGLIQTATRYQYDAQGRVSVAELGVDAVHETRRYRYDAADRLIAIEAEDQRGGRTRTTFQRDASGRLVSARRVDANAPGVELGHARWRYEGERLIEIEDALLGPPTLERIGWDAQGRPAWHVVIEAPETIHRRHTEDGALGEVAAGDRSRPSRAEAGVQGHGAEGGPIPVEERRLDRLYAATALAEGADDEPRDATPEWPLQDIIADDRGVEIIRLEFDAGVLVATVTLDRDAQGRPVVLAVGRAARWDRFYYACE